MNRSRPLKNSLASNLSIEALDALAALKQSISPPKPEKPKRTPSGAIEGEGKKTLLPRQKPKATKVKAGQKNKKQKTGSIAGTLAGSGVLPGPRTTSAYDSPYVTGYTQIVSSGRGAGTKR